MNRARLTAAARVAAPDLVLAGVHGYAFVNIVWIDDLPGGATLARFFESWPIAEALSLAVTFFVLAYFARAQERRRPWIDAVVFVAIFGVPLAFVAWALGALHNVWVFVLADITAYARRPPTTGQHVAGCLQTFVSGGLLVVLGALFMEPRGGLRLLRRAYSRATAYQVRMMAYGATYFTLRGAVTVLADWARRDADKERAVRPPREE